MDQETGTSKTFFNKRKGGPGCSSSSSSGSQRRGEDVCVVSVRNIADDVKKDGFTELFEDMRPPRPFVKSRGFRGDRDSRAPVDRSIDEPSEDYDWLSKQICQDPTPLHEMKCVVEGGVWKQTHLESPISSDSSETPVVVEDGHRIWIHYNTYVERGNKLLLIDSTRKHRLATSLDVGEEGMLGLYYAVKSMKKLELAEFLIEPEYAYGKLGIPGFIGGNERLRLVVQVQDIMVRPVENEEMLMEEMEADEEVDLTRLFVSAG